MNFRSLFCLTLLCLPLTAHAGYFDQREDVRSFIAEISARNQLDANTLVAAFADAEVQPRVIDYIKPPSQPGVRSWKRYRARFLDAPRISGGLKFWQTYQTTVDEAAKKTGVPAEIIVAIIGVETIYGRNTGNFQALSALATLAFDYPPRAELFRRELEALFLLARDQGEPVGNYLGSYAGAIGLPQFLPSSIRSFAVDGDGDGRVDLRGNPRDAIHSVANFLALHGWQRGAEIVRPAVLAEPTANLQPLLELGLLPSLDGALLAAYGISDPQAGPDKELVALIDFVTPGEPTQYQLGLQNFYVISRYNRSSFYAMSVVELARALRLERAARSELLATAPPVRKQSGKRSRH